MSLLEGELFVDAFNMPNHMVSNMGRVWSKKFKRMLAISPNHLGYIRLNTVVNGKQRSVGVHRLVLQSFYGDEPTLQACHISRDRQDNRICNIYWGTPWQNAQDKLKDGTHRIGARNPMATIDEPKARLIWADLQAGISYGDISKKYVVKKTLVRMINSGMSWGHVTGLNRKFKYIAKTSPDQLVSKIKAGV